MSLLIGKHILNDSIRSSVQPYTIKINKFTGEQELYYLMSIHKASGNLSDFGGGAKKDEKSKETAARELNEETKGTINIDPDILDNCLVYMALDRTTKNWKIPEKIICENEKSPMTIFFLPMKENEFEEICEKFKKLSPSCEDEISDIKIIQDKELFSLVYRDNGKYKMWNKLKNIYRTIFTQEFRKKLISQWNKTMIYKNPQE